MAKVGEVPDGIQKLFTEFIKPKTVLYEFGNILSKQEMERVCSVAKNTGDIDGANLLFEIFTTKDNWFKILLGILRSIKLQHIADMMEEEMRVFEYMKSSPQAARNWRTRVPDSQKHMPSIYIKYNTAMEADIRDLFTAYITPKYVTHLFAKCSNNKVLTKKDIQNVNAEVDNNGDAAGAHLLLERLILYEDWFSVLLKVLRESEVGLSHAANKMEEATSRTRLNYEQEKAQAKQIYSEFFPDEKQQTFSDSADMGIQMEDMAGTSEEYESDSTERKRGSDILLQETVSDLPKQESVSDLPKQESVSDLPKQESVSDLPKQESVSDLPKQESVSDLPKQSVESVDGSSGKNELIDAAAEGDAELLMSLIESGASDIDEADSKGRTALMYAALRGRTECIQILIVCGCDLNKQDDNGNTALMTACGEDYTECVNSLIDGHADVNVANRSGTTALMVTAKKGFADCMMLLLLCGKCELDKPHNDGTTALMYAARYGKLECLKLLIQSGSDVNMTTDKEQTALMFAAGNGLSDCLKILIDSGCAVNMFDSKGQTALMFAASNGHRACMELLIAGGAEIDRTDEKGNTAIMFAILGQHTECVKLLVTKNANLSITNCYGCTALKAAKKKGYSLS